ncbi:MAG TPA: alpha/beta fold hydrolase [Humibacter sp.]|nr:alpha/beta fold hydrolase [Humibacter sp.]
MTTVTTADGTPISYRVSVGDDPVLLVHGFGSDGAGTWAASGWLDALARAGRGALVVDLRGHGASGKPHDAPAYRLRVLAADLVAVLEDAGLQQADVIAYSMGSQVARALARDAPRRIRRLVLGGIGPVEQFRAWGVDAVRETLLDRVARERYPVAPEADAQAGGVPPTGVGILRAALEGSGADAVALAACAEAVASDVLLVGPMPVPTLLIVGGADSVSEGAEDFARRLHASFVSLPGRTHLTALGALGFKRAALDFLRADDSPGFDQA